MSAQITPTTFADQPALSLCSADGAKAIISLLGAQVLSWQPAGGSERLFLSPAARFDGTLPIRGGVPLCFPQFGTQGNLPRHGLVRTQRWQLADTATPDGQAIATLHLPWSEALLAQWPHAIELEFSVAIGGQRLDMELAVTTPNDCQFTAALHSYLAVADIEAVQISGLRGCRYRDATNGEMREERGNVVVIRGEVDRVYQDVPGALMLSDERHSLGIYGENFPDVVVWNPGPERCREIADLPDAAWQQFVCIEAGAISTPVSLAAGETWWARQSLVDLRAGSAD